MVILKAAVEELAEVGYGGVTIESVAARAGVGKSTIKRDKRVRGFHHRYSAERRQALIDLIALGIRQGEFRAGLDPELATVALLGAIFYRRLMTSEPFDPEHATQLVAAVLGQ
jgi:hypothetical protein